METVKIDMPEHRLGYIIINKSDFDPKKHTLYGDKKAGDENKPKRGRPAKE